MLINHCAWQYYTATYRLQNPSFNSFCWPVEEGKTERQNIQQFNKKWESHRQKEKGEKCSGILPYEGIMVTLPLELFYCHLSSFHLLTWAPHKTNIPGKKNTQMFFSYTHNTHTHFFYHLKEGNPLNSPKVILQSILFNYFKNVGLFDWYQIHQGSLVLAF